MKIIKYRKIYLIFSGTLTVVAILLWIMWGLKLGIDFTGGSLMEISYPDGRPAISEIKSQVSSLNLTDLKIQSSGDKGYILRFQQTGEETHQKVLAALNGQAAPAPVPANTNANVNVNAPAANANANANSNTNSNIIIQTEGGNSGISVEGIGVTAKTATAKIVEVRFDSIGPSIGAELKTKAFYSIILVVLFIILYIAYAFRKVSYPVKSWKYGIAAIIALIHDVFVTVGIFVILGKFFGFEVNTPFVAALLTILGYSVHDTIVVFDRVRENLKKYEGEFEDIVEKSIWETMARSINTIVTVELALGALAIFGGGVISDFVLPLFIGIFFGGYSSIFIASQIVVTWQKFDFAMKKEV